MRKIMTGKTTIRTCAVVFAIIMSIPAMCNMNVADMHVHGATMAGMENYPGVKHFNFASKEARSEVDEEDMIDPEYSIKMEKTMPDEYFGAKTTTKTDSDTGEVVTGFYLGDIEACKNKCGAICHNMFIYKGDWIDVKTTYVDWKVANRLTGFFGGGFTRQRWRGIYWVEMKHEFFLAGTDTPVEIKGFQNYADIDNNQGVILEKSKVEDVWINYKDSMLSYENITANANYTLANNNVYAPQREMLYIQTQTSGDIPEEGRSGYDAEIAARHCMGFTFDASVIHTCITDCSYTGLNLLESGYYKLIPSAPPQPGTPLVGKNVADSDEGPGESNSVKPDEEWNYYANAFVPEETESYNFYDSFRIEDQIDENLNIEDVGIWRGSDDVTNLFTVTKKNNKVTAVAKDVKTKTFYGYDYVLEIVVSLKSSREELEGKSLIDKNRCFVVPNQASAVYEAGSKSNDIPTNETLTTIQFEKMADIIITKEILKSDVHLPHGEISFIINLKGATSTGEEKEYNGHISFPEDYMKSNVDSSGKIRRTITFKDVPEGKWTCSEFETVRYGTSSIKELTGGVRKGDTVLFTIDSTDACKATFVNEKSDWSDYSHSCLVVNKVGKTQQ